MKFKKILTCFLAAAIAAGGIVTGNYFTPDTEKVSAVTTVSVGVIAGCAESAGMTWAPVSGADGYNVYIKPEGGSYTQLDPMLIRQYSGKFRADAVGLKAGKYVMKAVPTKDGKEDTSKNIETPAITVESYDRTGFGWVDGTSSGAYDENGTLKDNAVVLYITDENKDTVTLDVAKDTKGGMTTGTGLIEILSLYSKGYDNRPLDVRFIGNVTDMDGIDDNKDCKGDIVIDKCKCGVTLEGIGNDATINGFGIRVKNASNVEIRNLGFMNCNSDEGDDVGIQQSNDHIWVHNCDFFYGDAGSDADQVKGDGALDCKKSTYITFSYNHFWDNGKCNLLGLSEGTTDDLYITYHHNWYDHSDSRHPRVRFYSAHVYNNYYDGNAKYGVGSTMGSSVFVENNYFRNCKYPMLTAMQGSDIKYSDNPKGTFSEEDGGTIKAYGNYMTGQKAFVPYSENNTEFDAYVAKSRDEKVPSSVKSKKGSNIYNNFDTDSSIMYSYTVDDAEDVPDKVMAKAGRVGGGDFKWEFDNSVDDSSYAVNQPLKDALVAYKPSVLAIGSGFYEAGSEPATEPTTQPATSATTTTTKKSDTTTTTAASSVTVSISISSYTKETTTTAVASPDNTVTMPVVSFDESNVIYCSPGATPSGKGTADDPMDVLSAIAKVKPNGVIMLYGGTYKFDAPIVIDNENCGSVGKYKTITAVSDDVVWDFSAMETDGSNRGVILDGSYWCFEGFEITKAGDNGMLLSGSNNFIKDMVFNDNQDTGLQISRYRSSCDTIDTWPSNNLILNCTSKNNCDDKTMENADGFAAKLTCGEGNVFFGCMAYNNSDDGWDLYAKAETGPIGVVTIKNCIAFRNGFTEYGEGFGKCDGNGFKLGGEGVGTAHVVENCLAFENLNCGYTDNNNPKLGSLKNCTAYNNGIGGNDKPNVSCYRCTDGTGCDFSGIISYINEDKMNEICSANDGLTKKVSNDKFNGMIEKSIYYNGGNYYYIDEKMSIANKDKIGEKGASLTADDFVSLEVAAYNTAAPYDFHTGWRNNDGSINTHGFMVLKDTSRYYGTGADTDNGMPVPVNPDPSVTEATSTSESGSTTTTTSATPVTGVSTSPTSSTYLSDVSITNTSKASESRLTNTSNVSVPVSISVSEIPSEPDTTENIPDGKDYGDVNLDDEVSIADVVALNKYILNSDEYPLGNGTEESVLEAKANADVVRDKKINSSDSTMLMNYIGNIIDKIHLGEKI